MANESYRIQVIIDGQDDLSNPTDKARRSIQELSDEAERGKKSARSFGESWASFKDHAASFIGAAAVVGVAIGKINELGAQANAAQRTFNQVSGGVDAATESLGRMRTMTGGVIDDMALMKGASSLLVTGIADTNQKAEELVNLGARLSAVMGVDATEGIANLNSALLNNSFLRLDTLGISAARVRERVNELKDAGMDMSEAFSQAVIEIGTQTLGDLGDAANVAETAIARLATQMTNLGQNIAQDINADLEKAAVTLEQIIMLGAIATGNETGNAAIDAQIAKTEELTAATNDLITARESALRDSGVAVGSFLIGDISNQKFMDFAASNPELMNAQGQFGAPSSNIASGSFFTDAFSGDSADIAEARAILEELVGFELSDVPAEQLRMLALEADIAFSSIEDAQTTMTETTEATTLALVNQTRALEIQAQAAGWFGQTLDVIAEKSTKVQSAWQMSSATGFTVDKSGKTDSGGGWMMSSASGSQEAMSSYIALQDEALYGMKALTSQSEELNTTFLKGTMIIGENTFFDPTQLGNIQSQADELVAEYERLADIFETNPELVGEDEVARAKEIADAATETANEAERNAQAWESASLAMIAGASGGGRLNEFNQMVLSQIEDPEQRAAAEAQFNLTSGVETANTRVLDYGADLVATITEEMGNGVGAQAAATLVEAFEAGVQMGLEGEALQDYIENEVGFALAPTGGGEQITVQAGEGYQALAQRTGLAQEDIMAATGGRMLMAGEVITVGDGTSLIAVQGDPQETINSTIDSLFANASAAIAQPMTTSSSATNLTDYTYYNPATGTYDTANDPTATAMGDASATAALVSPEEVEAVSQIQSDVEEIQTGFAEISEYDLTEVVSPMATDIEAANTGLDDVHTSLAQLTSTEWRLSLPVDIFLDGTSAEWLSRNPTFIEAVRLVVPSTAAGGG